MPFCAIGQRNSWISWRMESSSLSGGVGTTRSANENGACTIAYALARSAANVPSKMSVSNSSQGQPSSMLSRHAGESFLQRADQYDGLDGLNNFSMTSQLCLPSMYCANSGAGRWICHNENRENQ